jgi:hypothetical protein
VIVGEAAVCGSGERFGPAVGMWRGGDIKNKTLDHKIKLKSLKLRIKGFILL